MEALINMETISQRPGEDKSFRRPTKPPVRARSHYQAILALLIERGERGVLASELYDCPALYGRSPRNRISEIRANGYRIEGQARGASDWHYTLVQDKPEQWQDRPRVTGLPLFDSVVR
jgi:hypothetical protein